MTAFIITVNVVMVAVVLAAGFLGRHVERRDRRREYAALPHVPWGSEPGADVDRERVAHDLAVHPR